MNEDKRAGLAPDEFLSPEVEKILRLSKQRVHKLVVDGRIPARRVLGRWVFNQADVIAFAARPRTGGRPRKMKEVTP